MPAAKGDTKHGSDARMLVSVSALHFINDLHPTLLPTFLPEIERRLSLSLGEAGFLSALFGVLNIVVQPFAGHIADRLDRPALALCAPLLTAGGAYLLPIAPSYGAALLIVSMIGFGTASFHPQGHGLTGIAGGRGHLGSYLAVFSAAGALGAALSPLYGVFLLKKLGPPLMPFAIFLVLAVVLVARCGLPRRFVDEERLSAKQTGDGRGAAGDGKASGGFFRVFMVCLPIILISIIRDSTSQGIRVFLPLLVTGRGGSIEFGGTLLFAFSVSGAVSSLMGGRMADLFGKRLLIFAMLAISPLLLFPAVVTRSASSVVLFVLGGACLAATNSVTLAMAQEYVPESRSTASSLVMGLSWGIANAVAFPIGKLGDAIGLESALCVVSFLPLLAVAAMVFGDARRRLRTLRGR
ncbi:MAG: MFS transporter [Synergistaceae bacterium]|nr:MFS transporter [Synergistaceae bacterium]